MRRRPLLTSIALVAAVATAGCSLNSSTGTATSTGASLTASGVAPSNPPAATGDPSVTASSAATCAPATLKTRKAGTLTVATGSPAYEPWFSANEPANGKGFESAVAYAVAQQLGYTTAQVIWVHAPFDSVIAHTPKSFDFDIDQVSITQSRKKAVDFSPAYYDVAQAVVALKTNKFAKATGTDALHGARLGAHGGTTSVDAVKNQIRPAASLHEYPTNAATVQALTSGKIDALVVNLPTALHLTSAELTNAVIIGQLPVVGSPEQFGLVLSKGSRLTSCVSRAVTALDHAGTLAELQTTWLTTSAGAAVLH